MFENKTDQSVRDEDEYCAGPKAPAQDRVPEYATGARLVLIVVGMILVLFLNMLDATIIGSAIPRITTEFDSLDDVGWYSGAYLMAMCAVQLPCGKILQLFESKRTFLVIVTIFLIGSIVCASAKSSAALIIGRAIAGIGAAGIQSSLMAILNASAPMSLQPKLIGICLGLGSLGLLLGPVLGGVLTETIGWRYAFWLNLPICAVVFITFLLIRLPNAQVSAARSRSVLERVWDLDLMGCFVWAGAISMLVLALNFGGTKYAWGSPAIALLLAGSGVLVLYFLAWEHHRGEQAMLSLRILGNRRVAAATAANLCMSGSFYSVAYFLPIYFQAVKGASPGMSGVYSLASVAAQMALSIPCGFITSKTGHFTPLMLIGCALGITAMSLLASMNVNTTIAEFTGYQILLGAARGLTIQPPLNTIQAYVPTEDIPVAGSLLMLSQNFGGSVWITAGQAIFAQLLRRTIHDLSPLVSISSVIDAGPLDFRSVLSGADIENVVEAYSKATTSTFFLSMAGVAAALFVSFGFGSRRLENKTTSSVTEEQVETQTDVQSKSM